MTRRAPARLLVLGLAASLATCPASGSDLRDLYFGEALFHANQGLYFDALQRLDTELAQHHGLDEPQFDSLHYHIGAAAFDGKPPRNAAARHNLTFLPQCGRNRSLAAASRQRRPWEGR